MNHEQFDHVLRAAGAVIGEDTVIVIGSQAILASVDRPPPAAARSIAVDVLPVDGDAVARKIAGTHGLFSLSLTNLASPRRELAVAQSARVHHWRFV